MIKGGKSKFLIWIALGLIALMSVVQLMNLFRSSPAATENAAYMLYEASAFQLDLLSRFMSEANEAGSSQGLDSLKQAAYSASYVHGRFVKIFQAGEMAPLSSLDGILQYVMRLQIGGVRPLQEKERMVIEQCAPLVSELYNSYAGLMSESGAINSDELDALASLDEQISDLLEQD